jgi:hypothetical protein
MHESTLTEIMSVDDLSWKYKRLACGPCSWIMHPQQVHSGTDGTLEVNDEFKIVVRKEAGFRGVLLLAFAQSDIALLYYVIPKGEATTMQPSYVLRPHHYPYMRFAQAQAFDAWLML